MKRHFLYCYLDLDLVIDLTSFLSSSNLLSSPVLESWRFSSPSSSDLISELPGDMFCPDRPAGRPACVNREININAQDSIYTVESVCSIQNRILKITMALFIQQLKERNVSSLITANDQVLFWHHLRRVSVPAHLSCSHVCTSRQCRALAKGTQPTGAALYLVTAPSQMWTVNRGSLNSSRPDTEGVTTQTWNCESLHQVTLPEVQHWRWCMHTIRFSCTLCKLLPPR